MKTYTLNIKLIIIALVFVVCLLPSMAGGEEFGGFGIVVAQLYDPDSPNNMGGIVVLHVPQASEAQKAGMRSGDIIFEVDGKQTTGREFGDIVLNSLRGEVGSYSDLKIKRAPGDKTITIRVKRALISYTPKTMK